MIRKRENKQLIFATPSNSYQDKNKFNPLSICRHRFSGHGPCGGQRLKHPKINNGFEIVNYG